MTSPVPPGTGPGGEHLPGVLRSARFGDIDATTLYALLRLRVAVFVVEQRCAYQELDGRDTEPDTLHVWLESGGEVLACLRVLREGGGGSRIGRVAVVESLRGRGAGRALLDHALAVAARPVVADVQAHLVGWYERAGFATDGEEFVEDGIPHVPMRLP